MSKCILDVWEGRIPTCMAGYLVCDEEKCPNFIQEVKIEKAIETLKARKKFIADINFDAHYAYDLAISALEKQIPSKIDYSELNYSNLPVSKCPECKNTTVNRLLECKYCPDCGQRLEWEVEND